MAKSNLKLAVTRKIQYSPVTSYTLPHIVEWAEKPANAEFFRRMPPLNTWLEPERALKLWQAAAAHIIFEDNTPVGMIVSGFTDQASRACEIGMLVDKEASTHRHLTFLHIMHDFIKNAFDYYNLHKVFVRVLTHRTEMRKTLESFGSVCEATLRDSVFFNGEYHDEWYISLLKLEYRRP